MRVLLTGKYGQVGWELNRALLPLCEVLAIDQNDIDLSKPDALRKAIGEICPDIIINAAAYTDVDRAESEEELATVINGQSPGVMAEEALKSNALLIHYSTDYVFDGTKVEPYTENDIPNPVNAYGRSKLAGEKAIIESGCDYLIIRTAWVFAARGKNFFRTVLRLAQEREELRIVADQFGAPTWARNIADVTSHVLSAVQKERRNNSFSSATYHLTSSGKTSWCGFTNAILERLRQLDTEGKPIARKVIPIATEDYPLPAPRPANSQLSSDELKGRFGLVLPEWQKALNLCIEEALRLQ